MNTWEHNLGQSCVDTLDRPSKPQPTLRPDYLCLLTAQEVEELRLCVRRGTVPPDLEAKLGRLAEGDLTHRFVARSCRLFIALLQAVEAGTFQGASQPPCERLLRVLAYVRKDEDAVADYKPAGFKDDQEEVRAALLEFPALLKEFKAWRLRQQVPGLWPNAHTPGPTARA